jgi:hypothetical protein
MLQEFQAAYSLIAMASHYVLEMHRRAEPVEKPQNPGTAACTYCAYKVIKFTDPSLPLPNAGRPSRCLDPKGNTMNDSHLGVLNSGQPWLTILNINVRADGPNMP